jgi:hypothetical protein
MTVDEVIEMRRLKRSQHYISSAKNYVAKDAKAIDTLEDLGSSNLPYRSQVRRGLMIFHHKK